MTEKLKNYFPMIREKEELLLEIQENVILRDLYGQLSPELKEELLDYCREHVAKYAMPRELEFRKELPKTLVGKVAYRVLEEEALAQQKA